MRRAADPEVADIPMARLPVDVGRFRPAAPSGRGAARGGVNGPWTEVMAATALLLGLDVPRVAGMVRGWPVALVSDLLEQSQKNGDKPAALWWFRYKVLKKQRGNKKKDGKGKGKEAAEEAAVPRPLRGVGPVGGEGERGQGQLALLGDREGRGGGAVGEG